MYIVCNTVDTSVTIDLFFMRDLFYDHRKEERNKTVGSTVQQLHGRLN